MGGWGELFLAKNPWLVNILVLWSRKWGEKISVVILFLDSFDKKRTIHKICIESKIFLFCEILKKKILSDKNISAYYAVGNM